MDAQDDLRYVREAVRQADAIDIPSIPFLWAGIVLVGSVLADFQPVAVGRYWLVAGPAGFLLSAIVGYRGRVRAGQLSPRPGISHMAHWASLLAAGALAYGLVITGVLTRRGFGSAMLLLVALCYIQAAIHIQRRFAWVGAAAVVGYLLTLSTTAYQWTMAGALVAAALVAHGFIPEAKHGASR